MRNTIDLIESAEKFERVPVAFEFDPAMSLQTFQVHYGELYKRYVERAQAGETSDFVLGGEQLHRIFFHMLQAPTTNNKPHGASLALILENWPTWQEFQAEFTGACMAVEGSAWVYLSTAGTIKTIKNHKPANNIALIIDMWEHAYVIDYGSNRSEYIKSFWKMINWSVVNIRLE